MLVEGAIFDADGPRPAYVRIRAGKVFETGQVGTDGTRGRVRRVRGIVLPSPVNGHTHLGDAVSVREPPRESVDRLVGTPASYKFRLLRDTPRTVKRRAIRVALRGMAREGIAGAIDFREEGRPGVELLREAARGSPVRVVALGRPLARPIDTAELRALLEVSDGIGLSSAREESEGSRRTIARACRSAGKRYALHASEATHERTEAYLEPRPDLLVHLAKASRDDLVAVRDEGVPVAVCPRANALFGRQPDLRTMERLGLTVLLGSDNAMLERPSIWRELEFAYTATRLLGRDVSAEFLARAALVAPWEWLGRPRDARIEAGSPARPLVLRLPPEDPAYQIATRVTEHVMVRPPTSLGGTSR